MNGRGNLCLFCLSRKISGRLTPLLWAFRRAFLALRFNGSTGSSSKWRRRGRSLTRWWSCYATEVGVHFGRFGSILAFLSTRDGDGATGMTWLSIDVGGGFRFVLAVWGKSGDQISCVLVVLVAWVVPSASPATRGLLKLGRCGFGSWDGFEARSKSFPRWLAFGPGWAVISLCFCFFVLFNLHAVVFLLQFVIGFGFVSKSQISHSPLKSGLLSGILVGVWFG